MKKRTAMHVERALPELLEDGLITQEQVEPLRAYCAKQEDGDNRTFIYPLIGAVVVALGVILLVADNWNDYSLWGRIGFSSGGLIIGQLLCLYTLLKRPDSVVWRESTASFVALMVAVPLIVVEQSYNLDHSFYLTWFFLSLPMMYVMRSVSAAVVTMGIYLMYMLEMDASGNLLLVFGMLGAVVPAWWLFAKENRNGTGAGIYDWAMCLVLSALYLWMSDRLFHGLFSFTLAYYSIIFCVLLLSPADLPLLQRPYWLVGWGTLGGCMLGASMNAPYYRAFSSLYWPGVFISVYVAAFLLALYTLWKKRSWNVFPLAVLPYGVAFQSSAVFNEGIGQLVASAFVLGMSLLQIRQGRKLDKVWQTLMGVLLLAILLLGHFFRPDFPPLFKGIAFIIIGTLFLAVRARRRKVSAAQEEEGVRS